MMASLMGGPGNSTGRRGVPGQRDSLSMIAAPIDASAVLSDPVEADPRVGDVLCYSGRRRRARLLAQRVADLERREVYVLWGFRPNRRCFRSRVYYVSLHPSPRIEVDGLPSPALVGPPCSGPLLLYVVRPQSTGSTGGVLDDPVLVTDLADGGRR